MTLFESTLILLAVAVVLLGAARRLGVPYPAMLALAGGCAAALPWAPRVDIEPRLALALFVAPAVLDAAFDMPPRELLRNWVPLTSLAVMLVLVTTVAVAWAGWAIAGLPLAAAAALGAIVAPPDAAAAAAVLRQFDLPRRALGVLQGESLLNDAVALLVFGAAVSAAASHDGAWSRSLPLLLVAVPGGALLGALVGALAVRLAFKVADSLSVIVVQFLLTFSTWILADRLGLSSIMAVVVLAMVAARYVPTRTSAHDRMTANTVWAMVVFVLNVLAFLLMGLQARVILSQLEGDALWHALGFAAIVLAVVIAVRFVWVMGYGSVARLLRSIFRPGAPALPVASTRLRVLVSWCGMRGLVTLATALALPPQFPGRDLIGVSAFTVVLGTLIIQGFTIRPLIEWLHIAPDHSLDDEVTRARTAMLDAALSTLAGHAGEAAAAVRAEYGAARAAAFASADPQTAHDKLRLIAIAAQRRVIAEWRREGRMGDDTYHRLEEELDRAELNAALPRDT